MPSFLPAIQLSGYEVAHAGAIDYYGYLIIFSEMKQQPTFKMEA